MDVDWYKMFTLELAPLDTFIRGTIIYWFIFLLLRLAGRRDAGTLGVADLLVLVLIGDAAGNAMLPGEASIGDAMIMIGTIIGWSVAVDRLGFFFPPLRRLLEPRKVCLIRDGQMQKRGMRRECITRDELMEAVRLAGLERIEDVRRAYIESNGDISIISGKNDVPHGPGLRSRPD